MFEPCPYHYLGFNRSPFPSTPDAEHYLLTEKTSTILIELLNVVQHNKGIALIIGDVGLGKTTFIRYFLSHLSETQYVTSLILNSYLQDEALLDGILKDFEVDVSGCSAKNLTNFEEKLTFFNQWLLACFREKKRCVLIIDDAQNLSDSSLEMLRLLTNLETNTEKLLQIILIGQQELFVTLKQPKLRQLYSRIVYQATFNRISYVEARAYVDNKLLMQARDPKAQLLTITPAGLWWLLRSSNFNPRTFNMLLDRGLHACIVNKTNVLGVRCAYLILKDMAWKKSKVKKTSFIWITMFLALLSYFILTDFFSQNVSRKSPSHQLMEHQPLAVVQDIPTPVIAPVRFSNIQNWLSEYGYLENFTGFESALINYDVETMEALLSAYEIKIKISKEKPNPLHVLKTFDLKNDQFLILWKPELWLEKYHYLAESQSVKSLQIALTIVGVYSDAIDGIVGRQTMQALMAFQLKHNLPSTGFPDRNTLFALHMTLRGLQHA
ncbi:ExeA family protein [Colwellia sp. Arc7-D]|uniref:ExeA family protein n=1 Tax=Colwellia sp. Arc7-D TaxID=2161872 RepID=UPI000D3715C9|nr:ExeA family protein [Colwellia sp. Arc7-D]AWB59172.1 hypothetical protein DBO93_17470 [Colwellia sp. Arc7-D]